MFQKLRNLQRLWYAWALAAALLAACVAPAVAQTPAPAQKQTAPAPAQPAAPAAQPQQPAAAPDKADAPPIPERISQSLDTMVKSVDTVEKTLQKIKDFDEDLGRLRNQVDDVLSHTTDLADRLRPQLAAVKDQIAKIGPAPAKDAPPEAPAITQERKRLTDQAAALDGAIKTAELTWVRARQLVERITDLRHSLFARNLMERLPSPLLPPLWTNARQEWPNLSHYIHYVVTDWWGTAQQRMGELAGLLALAVAVYAITRYIARRLVIWRRAWLSQRISTTPSFFARAAAVAWSAPLRLLPATLAALTIYAGLDALNLLSFPSDSIAASIFWGVLIFVAVASLVRAVLAPENPTWRLVPLSSRSARTICRLLQGIAAVYAVDMALSGINRALVVPLSITVVQAFLTTAVFSLLLIGLLVTPFEPSDHTPGEHIRRSAPVWVKLPLWAVAIGILAATCTGYVALGRFAAQQIVLTGVVLLVTGLLYLAIRAFTREPADTAYPVGDLLQTRFGLDEPRRHQLATLTEFALTLVLLIVAVPVLLLQWGFSWPDIRDWLTAALFGFEIGQFRISLARILIGLVLFTALLFLTRLFQRWLRDTVLQPPRVDAGIANSIDTTVGYAGIVVAALLAVSYAGVDITNLAIVAGALSVGIGFGLQSIVNNFVSGLILLVERPVKVGDIVAIGNDSGTIRRISVRATEIETPDRSSLIVPNSELITARVLNKTHRNSLGRAVIKIGVGYDADPEKVAALLLGVANEHPLVLAAPPPSALFENFGDSALEFTLIAQVSDLTQLGNVQSELRIAVLKAMRAEGIEIPFPQVDVTMRDLDAVKRLLAQAEQQRRQAASRPVNADGNGQPKPSD